jgi:hypothetical protein
MSVTREDPGHRRWTQRALVACLALACGSVWAQSSLDSSALRRLLTARGFSAAQAQATLATLERAEAHGLPASALESRLREGLARHAEPAVIQRVLDRRLGELEKADALARRGRQQGLVVRDRQGSLGRLADSFALGVAPGDVGGLLAPAARARRDLDGISRAAEVMGRLAQQGSPAADTRDVLGAALTAGWTREQMDGLVEVFASARRSAAAPGQVRRTLVAGIRGGESLDRLAARMKAETKALAEAKTVGSARAASRSGPAHSSPPKAGRGAGSPRGARPPARGPGPRAPAPRPHGPRGPMHVPRH